MSHHEVKLWPQFYAPVRDRIKTFELRKNDRGYQAGDTITLREWNPEIVWKEESGCHQLQTPSEWQEPFGYTKSPSLGPYKIGYVLPVDAERVVFSLLEVKP